MSTELDELKTLLGQLAETGKTVPSSWLYGLSDLSGEALVEFRTTWEAYPVQQRRRLIHALVGLAEASFEVNFDAIYRHCLGDADDDVRAAAIDGLWENDQVSLVGPLLTMLRADPSVRVRAAAAAGLGRFVLAGELEQLERPIQTRILTELLTAIHVADETVEVRRRALESAAYACLPDVLDALETAYDDEDQEMRISAIVGMGRTCDRRWRDAILAEMLSTSAAMRYAATLACGELALHQGVPTLRTLLDDPDPQVRDAAIWALGQISGPQARSALLAAFEGADHGTRAALEDALAEQALAEGELDFVLYDIDEDLGNGVADDEFLTLWPPEDETDMLDAEDWESADL